MADVSLTLESKITSYFPPSPKPKQCSISEEEVEEINSFDLEKAASVLLTPDSTPTKDVTKSENKCPPEPSDDASKPTELPSVKEEREQKPVVESSKPTEPKVIKSEEGVAVGEKCTSLPVVNGTKSTRRGRRRKGAKKIEKSETCQAPKPKLKTTRPKQESRNSLVTDYFPIRRSSRVPSSELKKREQSDLEEAILNEKTDGLKVEEFVGKGRGVVSTQPFRKGEFVVEYVGDLVDLDTAKQRERAYTGNLDVGCYMYYFNFRNKPYCVDATAESGKLGRLLNHSKTKPNCCTRVVGLGDRPHLILVAARDIEPGEELVYDYGDRNKETLAANPWLAY